MASKKTALFSGFNGIYCFPEVNYNLILAKHGKTAENTRKDVFLVIYWSCHKPTYLVVGSDGFWPFLDPKTPENTTFRTPFWALS